MAGPCLVVWDDRFLTYDFGPTHPFTERSRALAVRLFEATVPPEERPRVAWLSEVRVAGREELLRFHEDPYLERVARMAASRPSGFLDRGDTPAFPDCYAAAARIAGGALEGLAAVEDRRARRVFLPAGGFHHAAPAAASGFCVFNDIAVALRAWLERHPGHRVAYVDIDAHHGDGVMYGFYESGRVLAIDFHQDGRTLFPGTGFVTETGRGDGAGLKVNVPLPPYAGDEAFLPLFRRIVPPLLRSFRPHLLVLQHGVDAHAQDRLTQLQYTPRAYELALSEMCGLAEELAEGRLVVTGGGGYTAENVSRVLARAAHRLAETLVPSDEDPLPETWREEFARWFDREPPDRWWRPLPTFPSPWTEARGAKILAELAHALGRSFDSG